MLICGYGLYGQVFYYLGYELSKIERQVSLDAGAGGMEHATFQKLQTEKADEIASRGLQPLYRDYTSYFAPINVSFFRVLSAAEEDVATMLYTAGLESDGVADMVRTEFLQEVRSAANNPISAPEP